MPSAGGAAERRTLSVTRTSVTDLRAAANCASMEVLALSAPLQQLGRGVKQIPIGTLC
jgi:hypothetical protein